MSAQTFGVEVAGGRLHVGHWPGRPGAPTVIGAHGITANHLEFAALARELDGAVTLVAPDLRGRGRSNAIGEPYGITAHVEDLVAVLDHMGADRAVMLGHSMGGWVAALAAVRHSNRVASVILVDGGLALPLPAGLDVDTMLHAVLGPAMARLSMTFRSGAAYREFWQNVPPVGPYWSEEIAAYLDHDLVGEPPELRSSVSVDAVRGDATEQLTVPEVRDAAEAVRCPLHLLFAPRGLTDAEPLYPPEAIDAIRPRLRTLVSEAIIGDTNHYTIVMGSGAPTVAAVVRRAASELS